jgi:cytochrome b561
MPLRMTDQFDGVMKGFHWVMAILVIMMVVIGLRMTDLPNSPDKFLVYGWHKTFGMTILGLVVLRVLWRLHSPRPKPLPTHKPLELLLAHTVHIVLYGCLFLMPISGYVMSSAAGYGFKVWGIPIPMLVPPNKALMEQMKEFHEILSNILMAAVALHVLGALKHHFIDKDTTLIRMLPAMFTPRRRRV